MMPERAKTYDLRCQTYDFVGFGLLVKVYMSRTLCLGDTVWDLRGLALYSFMVLDIPVLEAI